MVPLLTSRPDASNSNRSNTAEVKMIEARVDSIDVASKLKDMW